ncbi:hypothetical protein D3C75_504910 [compost metagenome]
MVAYLPRVVTACHRARAQVVARDDRARVVGRVAGLQPVALSDGGNEPPLSGHPSVRAKLH